MATQAGLVNEALALMNSQAYVTGTLPNFDGSVAGAAAAIVYPIVRDLLLRVMDPEFARVTKVLVTATASPIIPWVYEYAYPADAVRARQIRPPASGAGALADTWDPQPVRGNVAYDPTLGTPARVVLTDQQNALLVYTSNTVSEAAWDGAFCDAFTRWLANPLAMALAGRPDFSRELLEQAQQQASLAAENHDL